MDKNEDLISTDKDNIGHSNDQLDQDENSEKDLESIPPAIENLANIMKQGNNNGENEKSPSNTASPEKKTSPRDQLLEEKPIKDSQESSRPIPSPAPRSVKKADTSPDRTVLESENLEMTPSKPKVGPRPPKSYKIDDSIMAEAGLVQDTDTVNISPVRPRSDIPKQTDRPKSAIIVTNNMSPVEVTRPLSMMAETQDHDLISQIEFDTGRNHTNSSEIISEPKVAPKPTPPKRPVRNIVSDAQYDAEAQPLPHYPPSKVEIIDRGSNERPKSEVITCTIPNSPIEAKRPLSVTDETVLKEDPSLENVSQGEYVTSPKRIPGVFASHHGAIGALAAAVTGRKNNFRSSHTESDGLMTSSNRNASPNTTETVEVADEKEGFDNFVSSASNEDSEKVLKVFS